MGSATPPAVSGPEQGMSKGDGRSVSLPARDRPPGDPCGAGRHALEWSRLEPRRADDVLHRQHDIRHRRLRLRPVVGRTVGSSQARRSPPRLGSARRHDSRRRRNALGRLLRRFFPTAFRIGRSAHRSRRPPGESGYELRFRRRRLLRPVRDVRDGRPTPQQSNHQPHAGGLFRLRPGVRGISANPFAG
jgi:hypothetical protein